MAAAQDGTHGHHSEIYPPPPELAKRAHIPSREVYDKLYAQSLADPEAFWGNIAKDFYWKKHWDSPFTR